MQVRRARRLIQIYRDKDLQDTTVNRKDVYVRQYSKQATVTPNEANNGGQAGTGQNGNQVSSAGGRCKALCAFTLRLPCYENISSILNMKYQESCVEALTIGFSSAWHKHSIPGRVIVKAPLGEHRTRGQGGKGTVGAVQCFTDITTACRRYLPLSFLLLLLFYSLLLYHLPHYI